MSPLLAPLLTKAADIISRFVPDPTESARAQLEVLKLADAKEARELTAALEELRLASENIKADATSSDKWTSRARPSFMYVIYILILSSIPMGVLYAFSPDTATAITTGFKSWLQAIPEEMLALFGVGYVGYATARSVEKVKGRVK